MGTIHADLFITLDGVVQSPGASIEDADGGFTLGGWLPPHFDETVGATVDANMQGLDALLLGHRSYQLLGSYWPTATGEDQPIADLYNSVPKYVASRGTPTLDWTGSVLVSDVPTQVREIKERHEKIHVVGSSDLLQTLLREGLVDQVNLWVFPVVLGAGKRLFGTGTIPAGFEPIEAPVLSASGVLHVRYAVAGDPVFADLPQASQLEG